MDHTKLAERDDLSSKPEDFGAIYDAPSNTLFIPSDIMMVLPNHAQKNAMHFVNYAMLAPSTVALYLGWKPHQAKAAIDALLAQLKPLSILPQSFYDPPRQFPAGGALNPHAPQMK